MRTGELQEAAQDKKMRLSRQQVYWLEASDSYSNDANSQLAARLTGPDHAIKFDDAEVIARFENRDLAIETAALLLRSKYNETENRLGHAQVLQLLKFCLKTYFTFDGTIYEQVKGTPMGLPISGFIAEAVLQRLESLVF
ncbi:hypothetical protein SprV_0200873000 [Sparganum proliferum]